MFLRRTLTDFYWFARTGFDRRHDIIHLKKNRRKKKKRGWRRSPIFSGETATCSRVGVVDEKADLGRSESVAQPWTSGSTTTSSTISSSDWNRPRPSVRLENGQSGSRSSKYVPIAVRTWRRRKRKRKFCLVVYFFFQNESSKSRAFLSSASIQLSPCGYQT